MDNPNKEYAIVRFDDETVSEIPRKWLFNKNTMCWWPPSKNASAFISKNVTPSDKWKEYKVVVELFCDSLEVARKKAEDINYSESEEQGRGKRTKKTRILSDYENSSSDSDDYRNRRLEKMPSLSTPFSLSADGLLVLENDKIEAEQIGTPEIDEQVNLLNSQHIDGSSVDSGEMYVVTHEVEGETKDNDVTNMLVRILKGISAIQLQLNEISSALQKTKCQNTDQFQHIRDLLPIKSVAGLGEVEKYMEENTENRDIMKKYLSLIGGSSVKDNVNRIYKHIFANSFAVQCSWLGLRQNFKISSCELITLTKCVILETFNANLKEFETVSSEWFRHAKQRLKRECSLHET